MSRGPGGGLPSGSNLLGLELCALMVTFPPWMGGHVNTCTDWGGGRCERRWAHSVRVRWWRLKGRGRKGRKYLLEVVFILG